MSDKDQKKRVLFADDSKVARALMEDFLKNKFEVILATNGLEALKRAYKDRPDLIILDLQMPIIEGHIASRILKEDKRTSNIPILMFTAFSEHRFHVSRDIIHIHYLSSPCNVVKACSLKELIV